MFAHKLLDEEQKSFIIALNKTYLEPSKISILLYNKYQIKLSQEQIQFIIQEEYDKSKEKKTAETVDLENYMKNISGASFIYPEDDGRNIQIRQGISTFTKDEFISIDPTFASLSTH